MGNREKGPFGFQIFFMEFIRNSDEKDFPTGFAIIVSFQFSHNSWYSSQEIGIKISDFGLKLGGGSVAEGVSKGWFFSWRFWLVFVGFENNAAKLLTCLEVEELGTFRVSPALSEHLSGGSVSESCVCGVRGGGILSLLVFFSILILLITTWALESLLLSPIGLGCNLLRFVSGLNSPPKISFIFYQFYYFSR